MVQAISSNMGRRIVKTVHGGLSCNKASKRFDVAVSTVVKLIKHVEETGGISPKKIGGYCSPKLAAHDAEVRALVSATPDATLEELVAAFAGLALRPAARRLTGTLVESAGASKKPFTRPSKTGLRQVQSQATQVRRKDS
jgi:hypothetical protein